MAEQDGIKAGRIIKPYGFEGEVQVILDPLVSGHIIKGIALFIDMEGQRVPFFTEEVDLIGKDQAIIKFEFIGDPESARKICGREVFLDLQSARNVENAGPLLQSVVGFLVRDVTLGDLGEVTGYTASDMNPCWTIRYKSKEILVPAAEEFVRRIDRRKKILHLNLPEGITEL
jgi:16S rRNA processing protein RimM